MRVKKVPLQDLELWPDEVICFTAYTDTRNPAQQRRTYVDGAALEAENDKLRKALRAAWKCAHVGISCSDCRLIAGGCTLQSAMCELGIEVE